MLGLVESYIQPGATFGIDVAITSQFPLMHVQVSKMAVIFAKFMLNKTASMKERFVNFGFVRKPQTNKKIKLLTRCFANKIRIRIM
jgi:hypothetical protein